MKRYFAFGLAFAAVFAAGAVIAQVPSLFLATPTGQETLDVTLGGAGPQYTEIYLSQARDSRGYAKLVPTTGTTYTVPAGKSQIQATPAGGLSAWTVKTPIAPVDGECLFIFTTQTITTFNLTASGTQTVNGNLAGSLSANTGVGYIYSASNTTWDRIQ